MINWYKYGKYFNEKINDGDIITFVKENNDPVKIEVISKQMSDFKVTYRGKSVITNFALQDFYKKNCIEIKVNDQNITSEVS